MKVGETFLGVIDDQHLCVVIAGTTELAIVNFTSHRLPCDESCIVQPGDHPFVKHPTIVAYQRAFIQLNDELEAKRSAGSLRMREPLSASLLLRIQQGALISKATPNKIKNAVRTLIN